MLLPAVAIRYHRGQSFAVGGTHLDIDPSRIAHYRTDPVFMESYDCVVPLAMSLSTYRALVTICPDMHLIEWDFFKEMPFVVEKDPELLKQTSCLISRWRTITAAIQNQNRNIISAMQTTDRKAA